MVAALRARVNYPGNIVNSPEFARLAQTVRAGSPALRYRAVSEYRDAFPDLVILRRNDEFPALTAAIDKCIPAASRARMRTAAASGVAALPARASILAWRFHRATPAPGGLRADACSVAHASLG
jgi:hypothetical protein